MAQFIRGLIFWPLLIVAVMLAIANRGSVQFSFDPFNAETPAFAVQTPLFMVLMVGVFLGLFLGGLSTWADQGRWRRAARHYRQRIAQLEATQSTAMRQAEAAQARTGTAVALSRTG